MRDGDRVTKDIRQFGSLVTAGPFPVLQTGGRTVWYFPRPLDLLDDTLRPALSPTALFDSALSSLPDPLEYAVANRLAPGKGSLAKAWLRADVFQRYFDGGNTRLSEGEAIDDSAFCDVEATVGIAIDAATATTGLGGAAGKIYSARYLRLRDDWRLGVFAKTDEKNGPPDSRADLIREFIKEDHQLLVGGQQRLCTATLQHNGPLPLPRGKVSRFTPHDDKCLVKWILLSPAIWPAIADRSRDGRSMTPHPGGWLPNWVHPEEGRVMLRSGDRRSRRYAGKHSRGFAAGSAEIIARLVAALVPKPVPVTGWALANEAAERPTEGAKSTHLAVPAGAVYYFETQANHELGTTAEQEAAALAAALNWHGSEANPMVIKNRRSTLMGEKGFGLGVCGTWHFYDGSTTP